MTATEGLRERKKRLTRQRISDTATAMFLEHGYDAVTVAEVARACDVSEKTVFNYFPTKESLILDREQEWAAEVGRAVRGPGSPVQAVVGVIVGQVEAMFSAGPDDGRTRRLGELIRQTPALRAANQQMTDRIAGVTAEALAARLGVDPGDPVPQIAAFALLGLWRVQFRSIGRDPDRAKVIAEVRRAAEVLDRGLGAVFAPPAGSGQG